MISPEIEQLIALLMKLPGLGPRSARRLSLELVKKRETVMLPLSECMNHVANKITACETCGNLDSHSPCTICRAPERDRSQICVVSEISDLWAMERASVFRGYYHVIGGTLSAIDGISPQDLNIANLVTRAQDPEIHEVILAMSETINGRTTAHYIMDKLANSSVRITRLASGVPIGGELDYLDDGTIAAALRSRQSF